jgi:hypothetical protein
MSCLAQPPEVKLHLARPLGCGHGLADPYEKSSTSPDPEGTGSASLDPVVRAPLRPTLRVRIQPYLP